MGEMKMFGSNLQPRKVKKPNPSEPWECICGHTNAQWYLTCQMCTVTWELSEQAHAIPD